jgi:hypothetical protein
VYVAGLDNKLAGVELQAITQLDEDHAFFKHIDDFFH